MMGSMTATMAFTSSAMKRTRLPISAAPLSRSAPTMRYGNAPMLGAAMPMSRYDMRLRVPCVRQRLRAFQILLSDSSSEPLKYVK